MAHCRANSKLRGPKLRFRHYETGTKPFAKCAELCLELLDRGIEPPSSPFDWPVLGSRWDFPITKDPNAEATGK